MRRNSVCSTCRIHRFVSLYLLINLKAVPCVHKSNLGPQSASVRQYYNQLKDCSWKSFDEFKVIWAEIGCVKSYSDHMTCSCAEYGEAYTCRHILGFQIRDGTVQVMKSTNYSDLTNSYDFAQMLNLYIYIY
jgi:hypothetical protein